jgi:hypothetical protein
MRRPETDAYLDKARRSLQEERVVAAAGFPDAAGRAAYLAAYHIAQGFIFDRTGKAAKIHIDAHLPPWPEQAGAPGQLSAAVRLDIMMPQP